LVGEPVHISEDQVSGSDTVLGTHSLRPKEASEADVTPITMQFSC
jgi:hypothetical protein